MNDHKDPYDNTADKINYWRTKNGQEVDLVIKKDSKLIPIEIKSGNQQSIPSGLKSFINEYAPETAYVLNWSETKDTKYKNTKILFRPLWFKI